MSLATDSKISGLSNSSPCVIVIRALMFIWALMFIFIKALMFMRALIVHKGLDVS